jgi:hypothetical protein
MVVRFLKDYRSRVWMCRYGANVVANVEQPELLREVLAGGFAEPVTLPSTQDAPVVIAKAPVVEMSVKPSRAKGKS